MNQKHQKKGAKNMRKETVDKILANHGMHPSMEVTSVYIKLIDTETQKTNYLPHSRLSLMAWLGY